MAPRVDKSRGRFGFRLAGIRYPELLATLQISAGLSYMLIQFQVGFPLRGKITHIYTGRLLFILLLFFLCKKMVV